MAARNDLQIALTNMGNANDLSPEQALKCLRRSRDIAAKYSRADAEAAKRIMFILNDAQKTISFAKDPNAFLKFVAKECLERLVSS